MNLYIANEENRVSLSRWKLLQTDRALTAESVATQITSCTLSSFVNDVVEYFSKTSDDPQLTKVYKTLIRNAHAATFARELDAVYHEDETVLPDEHFPINIATSRELCVEDFLQKLSNHMGESRNRVAGLLV